MKIAVAAALLVACVLFVSTQVENDAVHMSQSDTLDQTTEELASAADHAKMLKNICRVRSFSELAYDKALDLKNSRARSALLDFIVHFAKDAITEKDSVEEAQSVRQSKEIVYKQKSNQKARVQKKVDTDEYFLLRNLPFPKASASDTSAVNKEAVGTPITFNVVIDYAKAIAATKVKFNRGINKYILSHLTEAIVKGEDVLGEKPNSVTHRLGKITFNSKLLGFVSTPRYFKKLAVKSVAFYKGYEACMSKSKSADVLAATAWLKSGAAKKYKTFLEREEDKKNAKIAAFEHEKDSSALANIKKAFAKATGDTKNLFARLAPLPEAGSEGASTVEPPSIRSPATVNKDAIKASQAWVKENDDKSDKDVVAADMKQDEKVDEKVETEEEDRVEEYAKRDAAAEKKAQETAKVAAEKVAKAAEAKATKKEKDEKKAEKAKLAEEKAEKAAAKAAEKAAAEKAAAEKAKAVAAEKAVKKAEEKAKEDAAAAKKAEKAEKAEKAAVKVAEKAEKAAEEKAKATKKEKDEKKAEKAKLAEEKAEKAEEKAEKARKKAEEAAAKAAARAAARAAAERNTKEVASKVPVYSNSCKKTCTVSAYSDYSFGGSRVSHKSFQSNTNGWKPSGRDNTYSVKLSSGCKSVKVRDADDHQWDRGSQDKTYTSSKATLPYDLRADVEAYDIKVKTYRCCVKNC